MKLLSSSEKKQLQQKLKEKFGIDKLNYLLFQSGKQKIRGFSGSLSREELATLTRTLRVEVIGLYLMKQDLGLRLSLDGTHILKPEKNIINLTPQQALAWMQGKELDIKAKKGFLILKHKEDFLGSGLSTGSLIKNFIPKERRLK